MGGLHDDRRGRPRGRAQPLLVLAALVAGGFWGFLYLRTGRIAPVAVSHAAWDLLVFLVLPFR
jgi:membrane protease YdiL (CAAX protease family)